MVNSSIQKFFFMIGLFFGFPLTLTKKKRIMEQNVMGKNQFLFIVANKMFLMIIDKGRNTIINTNFQRKTLMNGQLLMMKNNYVYFLPKNGLYIDSKSIFMEVIRELTPVGLAPKEFTEIFSLIRTEFPPGGRRVILS